MANIPLEPANGDYESLLKKLEQNFIDELKRDSRLSAIEHQHHSSKEPESFLNLDDKGNAVLKKIQDQPEFDVDAQKDSSAISNSASNGQAAGSVDAISRHGLKQSLFKYKSSKADLLAKSKENAAFGKIDVNNQNKNYNTVSRVAKVKFVVILVMFLCIALIVSGLVPDDFRVFLIFVTVMCAIIIITSRKQKNSKK